MNSGPGYLRQSRSDVEPEMHDVAIAYHVILAFQPQLAGVLRTMLAFAGDVVVVGDGLGADEAVLEVGVNAPARLRRRRAHLYRPGPDFLRAGGKKGLQA